MNPHHANIGDVVKHLVLAETLHRDPPRRYLESHAGQADYPLLGKPGRTHDAIQLLREAEDSQLLSDSAYLRLLRDSALRRRYPGSVAVALGQLGNTADYVFYDLVEESLGSIVELAGHLAVDTDRLTTRLSDGLRGVCADIEPRDFVLLDPFHVFERVLDGPDTMECFASLALDDCRALLWYPLVATGDARTITQALPSGVHRFDFWLDDPAAGLAGCGMAASGVHEDAWHAALQLVDELSHSWGADLAVESH